MKREVRSGGGRGREKRETSDLSGRGAGRWLDFSSSKSGMCVFPTQFPLAPLLSPSNSGVILLVTRHLKLGRRVNMTLRYTLKLFAFLMLDLLQRMVSSSAQKPHTIHGSGMKPVIINL
jgi:hypothetical protein